MYPLRRIETVRPPGSTRASSEEATSTSWSVPPTSTESANSSKRTGSSERSGYTYRVLPSTIGQHLDVAEDDAARAARGDREDARAVGAAVDPLEERRVVALAHRDAVLRRGLALLDDLALDELAVRLEREARDHRGGRDREPVPALDRLAAGVRERLIDLGLGDAVAEDGVHDLLRDAELARRRAGGRRRIEAVEAARAAADRARAALVAHAAGPVLPERDRRDGGLAVGLRDALLAGVDLDAPAGRREDREAARDVDGDVLAVALDADARVGGGDAIRADRALERVAVDARSLEEDLAGRDVDAALEELQARFAAQEEGCAFAGANERARALRGA